MNARIGGSIICKACKADVLIHVARYGNMPKNIECSHGVCWCENVKSHKIYKADNYGGFEANSSKAKFCPQCGRKLEAI